METEPLDSPPPKRQRRWYQFSLRTLLGGVTLLAVACGYVGWQAKIVRERTAVARELYDAGAVFITSRQLTGRGAKSYSMEGKDFTPPYPSVNLVRRWFGDDFVLGIKWRWSVPSTNETWAAAVFPEAVIERQAK